MVFDKVKEIIVRQLEVNPDLITMETSFLDDLDADSLTLIELIADFEDEFDVEIDESQLEIIITVKVFVNYFESL